MHLFLSNILIFNFYLFYMLQTRGFIFRKAAVYTGIVCVRCISISSLLLTTLLILMHVKHTIP